jgi:2-oxoglutarate ferredoxin oxidoreductase subunit alpha
VYVVEQNRDAQMAQLVKLESAADAHKVRSVLHYIGLPIDARFVYDEVQKLEGAANPAAVPQGVLR